MPTFNAPWPEEIDRVDGRSLVSMEQEDDLIRFKNRSGDVVSQWFDIKNETVSVPALKTLKSFDSPFNRDVIVKNFYDPFYPPTFSLYNIGGIQQSSLDWSPCGRYLALRVRQLVTPGDPESGYNHNIRLYARGPLTDTLALLDTNNVASAPTIASYGRTTWSPMSRFLATVTHNGLRVYTRTGNNLDATPGGNLPFMQDIAWWKSSSTTEVLTGIYLDNSNPADPHMRLASWSANISSGTLAPASAWRLDLDPDEGPFILSYSPDGMVMVIISELNNRMTRFRTDNMSVITSSVTNAPNNGCRPAWSPNGRFMARVVTSGSGHPQIYLHERDGDYGITTRSVTYLTEGAPSSLADLRWTPDGRSLIFTRPMGASGTLISLHNFNDGFVSPVLQRVSINHSLPIASSDVVSLSPDGKFLVFSNTSEDGFAIVKSPELPVPGVISRID